jgi:hypothetical protein
MTSQSRPSWRYKNAKISYEFSITPRFHAGSTITAGEAAALNKLMAENVSNNMRSEFQRLCASLEPGEVLSAGAVEAMQLAIERYAGGYQFPDPALRNGATPRTSGSLQRMLQEVAVEEIEAMCRRRGLEATEELVERLLSEYIARSEVQQEAQRRLRAFASVASSALAELL